tara:strand:- start:88 stop:699 length:612 start_codon:yes stop_codon:yes gene_type:complete
MDGKTVVIFLLLFLYGTEVMANIYNNPGNILLGENFAGETGKYYTGKKRLRYAVFDSPEMGIRALYQDIRSKLRRSDGDVEDAMLRYLGGDNDEDSKEDRYKKASTDNEDVKGYIKRAKEAYEKEGEDGLVKQIIKNENKPETQRYYLDNPQSITTGKKLAIMDLPSGTSFENAVKVYQQGEYPRKHGGMVMRNYYDYEPRSI